MRLVGVSMVRNEFDVIESHVRHNLALLDSMTVIDHGSRDGTLEILGSLQREGLALRVLRDASPAFFQAERMTAGVRDALSGQDADFAFALDADEFLRVTSRADLETALRGIPVDAHGALHWLTYVPALSEPSVSQVGVPRLRQRLKIERHGSCKSVVGRSFVERPAQYLVSGNHLVDDPSLSGPPRHFRLPSEVAALAHCPVRSRVQLERKIILGYLAHRATHPRNDRQALHWHELFVYLRDGGMLQETELRRIACNYGLPRELWQPVETIELVDDPVALQGELRYTPEVSADTLRLLMAFTEELLR